MSAITPAEHKLLPPPFDLPSSCFTDKHINDGENERDHWKRGPPGLKYGNMLAKQHGCWFTDENITWQRARRGKVTKEEKLLPHQEGEKNIVISYKSTMVALSSKHSHLTGDIALRQSCSVRPFPNQICYCISILMRIKGIDIDTTVWHA